MSSKTQFKQALKGDKKIITDLKSQIQLKEDEIYKLRQLNHQLKNQLSALPKNYKLKKWWQFWK